MELDQNAVEILNDYSTRCVKDGGFNLPNRRALDLSGGNAVDPASRTRLMLRAAEHNLRRIGS